jgi:hypothetical protein
MPCATNLANTGQYVWHLSDGLPARLMVRAEATDRVGNTGGDQATLPAPIDLSRPEAAITHVGRNGAAQASASQAESR